MSLEGSSSIPSTIETPAVKMEQDTAMTDAPIPLLDGEVPSAHTDATGTMPRATTTNGAAASGPSSSAAAALPAEAAHHGAPTRDWINTRVTGVLLDGMKLLAVERPEAPLRALGEYLLKRSAEIEGPGGGGNGIGGQ